MKVLVLGGTGVISREIVKLLLAEQHEVSVYNRGSKQLEFPGEIRVLTGDRSDRIRTYNYPQGRVTDHRINLTLYKLDNVIAGNLAPVSEALIDHDREQLRSSMDIEE